MVSTRQVPSTRKTTVSVSDARRRPPWRCPRRCLPQQEVSSARTHRRDARGLRGHRPRGRPATRAGHAARPWRQPSPPAPNAGPPNRIAHRRRRRHRIGQRLRRRLARSQPTSSAALGRPLPVLYRRSIGRRPWAISNGAIIVALIVALATSLAAFTNSYDTAKVRDARYANGADIRITPSPTSTRTYTAEDARLFRTDGVRGATPVIYGLSNVILRSARTSDPANVAAIDPDERSNPYVPVLRAPASSRSTPAPPPSPATSRASPPSTSPGSSTSTPPSRSPWRWSPSPSSSLACFSSADANTSPFGPRDSNPARCACSSPSKPPPSHCRRGRRCRRRTGDGRLLRHRPSPLVRAHAELHRSARRSCHTRATRPRRDPRIQHRCLTSRQPTRPHRTAPRRIEAVLTEIFEAVKPLVERRPAAVSLRSAGGA